MCRLGVCWVSKPFASRCATLVVLAPLALDRLRRSQRGARSCGAESRTHHPLLRHTAVAAMPTRAWKPVKIKQDNITIEGGACPGVFALETRDIHDGARSVRFVRVEKNMGWLLKIVGGKEMRRGSLRRTRLLEELKEKLRHAGSVVSDIPQLAGEMTSAVAEADEMSALMPVSGDTPPTRKRKYQPRRPLGMISRIIMPEKEPKQNPKATATREVRIFATGTNALWVCLSDLAWLVEWLADEIACGGVPLDTGDIGTSSADVAVAADVSPEDIAVKWDFAGAWEARVPCGPLEGQVIRSRPDKFCAKKWAAVADACGFAHKLAEASPEQRDTACRRFLAQSVADLANSPPEQRGE